MNIVAYAHNVKRFEGRSLRAAAGGILRGNETSHNGEPSGSCSVSGEAYNQTHIQTVIVIHPILNTDAEPRMLENSV
jgi:hypothetical protein